MCIRDSTKAVTNTELLEHSNPISLASIYSLVLWALQGKRCGDGYGFPFDRPLLGFVDRLLELEQHMPELLELFLDDDKPGESQPVFKLLTEACFVAEDQELRNAADELHWRCKVFDSLRTAMRIAPVGGSKGLNDEGLPSAMATIRQSVEKFRRSLGQNPELVTDRLRKKWPPKLTSTTTSSLPTPFLCRHQLGRP
jgi:hypothetical protein